MCLRSPRLTTKAIDIYPEPEHPSTEQLEGSQLWPSEDDVPGFQAEMLAYTERMKIVGKAFMRVMGDALGEQEAFKALQQDNYWYVLLCTTYGLMPPGFCASLATPHCRKTLIRQRVYLVVPIPTMAVLLFCWPTTFLAPSKVGPDRDCMTWA